MAFIAIEGDTGAGLCLSPEHNVLGVQVPTPATTTFDAELARNVFINNELIVLRDSEGTATCGHTTTATTGADIYIGRVFCENKGVHCDTEEMGFGEFNQGGSYTVNPIVARNVTILTEQI
tara:strand:+ start:85 stop:447 length:363 start_codon:yes stop_codon:yes gene_type:complete